MKTFLQQLISDGEMPSSMRLMTLVIVVPVMIVWTVLCIRQNKFIIPDWNIVAMVITAISGKAVQSIAENRSSVSAPKQTSTPNQPS